MSWRFGLVASSFPSFSLFPTFFLPLFPNFGTGEIFMGQIPNRGTNFSSCRSDRKSIFPPKSVDGKKVGKLTHFPRHPIFPARKIVLAHAHDDERQWHPFSPPVSISPSLSTKQHPADQYTNAQPEMIPHLPDQTLSLINLSWRRHLCYLRHVFSPIFQEDGDYFIFPFLKLLPFSERRSESRALLTLFSNQLPPSHFPTTYVRGEKRRKRERRRRMAATTMTHKASFLPCLPLVA